MPNTQKVLGVAGILVVVSTSLSANDAYDFRDIGQHKKGFYWAGNDRVIFVACEFRGSFNHGNATKAFSRAVEYARQHGVTASEKRDVRSNDPYRNQYHRLAGDRHAVIGWFNLSRNDWQWFAVKVHSKTSIRFLGNNGRSGKSDDWNHFRSLTNGYEVKIAFADDDRGGIAWRFVGPK